MWELGYRTTWEPGYYSPPHILIVYYSRLGVVKHLAELLAQRARRVDGVDTAFLEVAEQPLPAHHRPSGRTLPWLIPQTR